MSRTEDHEPATSPAPSCPALEAVIIPRARDIGAFEVRRALPSAERKLVGPFIFFDQMGQAMIPPGKGLDVRPHPHIGLATVTYLLEGVIMHRDSLGNALEIAPGAVNLMTAGEGITHSERTPDDRRATGGPVYGIQSWMALPKRLEDTAPAFAHTPEADLPVIEEAGMTIRLIMGRLHGETSPVTTYQDMFYADVRLGAGAVFPLPADHEDRGIYVLEGEVEIAGDRFGAGQMLVFRPGDAITLKALSDARLMALGGETMDGPRHIKWNFVHSDRDAIHAAEEAWKAADWENGPFALPPGDDQEHIPL